MFKVKYRLMNDEPVEAGAPSGDPSGEPEKQETKAVSAEEHAKLMGEVESMRNHMKALLDEKKRADAAAKLAQEEAEQRELENSKKAQNIEEFEQRNNALWQGKMETKDERISLLELQLETQAKKAAESGLLSKFSDESMGELALEKMVHVTLDDDLKSVTEYRDMNGNVITTDKEVFIEYLNTNHPSWMRGAESSKKVVDQKLVDVTPELKGMYTDRAKSINEMVSAVPALKDLPVR